MNSNLKLSVILPMYNVAPYVEHCVRSIENQNLDKEEFEIICVNDGSPDNSADVVAKLQKEFDNIILINQKNQGVSMARNKGIDSAKGKYVLFVDPDDWIHENLLGEMMEEVEEKKVQMAIPAYSIQDATGKVETLKKFDQYIGKVYSGIEGYDITHKKGQLFGGFVIGIIIENAFLRKYNLRYPQNVVLNQDEAFLGTLHCLAERCIFVKQELYTSVERAGSATRSNQFTTDRVRRGFNLAAVYLKELQEKDFLSLEQKKFVNGPVAQFVILALSSAVTSKSWFKIKEAINDLKVNGIEKLNLEGCKGDHLICGRPFNISPYFGVLVLAFYLKIDRWLLDPYFKKRASKSQ
ncbi:glycosyltransferase [Saccharicrinis sp. 156]|uniref:glycosyltransferase n=1 Tax=Saccharicrinis sp. 156 TaxID=3417574 RepID=UPI003D328E68